jgi:predicted 2-oxoglutarate/Fe(II)-dependent dioxygenase YbiX/peroxiredoxin
MPVPRQLPQPRAWTKISALLFLLEIEMATYINLLPGDPAPDFHQRSFANPKYSFNVAAGRYMVLCFFGTSINKHAKAVKQAVEARPGIFNDDFASFFGVTIDPNDDDKERVADKYPGYRYFLDFDLTISRKYGSVDKDATELPAFADVRRIWVVLDPTMRIMRVTEFKEDQSDIEEIINYLSALPPPEKFVGFELQAPIIVLPNVFEPELCNRLIGLYESNGGIDSGFMREENGKTVAALNHSHKSRKDYQIEDQKLISELQNRFFRRVLPEIAKIHQYQVTRMERYIVACYADTDGGHFSSHRDNTTKGTAHRRFAVSVNLNDDFDGGEVSFPEYGRRSFKAPAGGAVVFSCSLLHAVSKVTRGKRYAFLPFLYDDAAAAIREKNNQFLGDNVSAYKGVAAPAET